MIVSFKHKGLEAFYTKGTKAGIQAIHAPRLRELLTALNVAAGPPGACMDWLATEPVFMQ